MPENKWYAYLLCCKDGSLYCGITTDLSRRLREHNEGRAGARYTRTRRPVTLVYSREFPDRAAAARFEYQLKQLDRPAKLMLIAEKEPVQIL
jgi:putative endonuclease